LSPSSEPQKSLIIAGGGTGGHVAAGIAVADAWRQKYGSDARVVFVGAQGGIEEKMVPRTGYPLELLKLGSLKGVSWSRRLKTLVQLPLSLLRSFGVVIRERPDAVLGVGGYASGPLVLVARVLARTAILEQNAVPGFTNRVLGKVVHRVFSAFPGVEGLFPGGKVTLTGNPVRAAMQPMPSASREPFTVFIFGGSQGAMGINSLVLDALPHLTDLLPRLRFVHQTGERDHERTAEGHRKASTSARVEKFIHDMPSVYRESSLLVCRAGSSTLSEIAAVGRAAVLIPFPYASDNHQEKNAEIFVHGGAAWLLRQQTAKGEDLAKIIREALTQPARIDQMEKAVRAFYRPTAAQDIVSQLSGN
jgi:UDP-N-acetylglucosamine--N-acetylmuramyl-(pentapeptide) pyrophosphoryl-undecaprenol N-acetylglucosamine transferase